MGSAGCACERDEMAYENVTRSGRRIWHLALEAGADDNPRAAAAQVARDRAKARPGRPPARAGVSHVTASCTSGYTSTGVGEGRSANLL